MFAGALSPLAAWAAGKEKSATTARAATKKWRDAAVQSEAERLALAESSKMKNEEIDVLRAIACDLDNRLEEEIERFKEAMKVKKITATA